MEEEDFSGVHIGPSIPLTPTVTFMELFGRTDVPKIRLLEITGESGSDFYLHEGILIISEQVYDFLREFDMSGVQFDLIRGEYHSIDDK